MTEMMEPYIDATEQLVTEMFVRDMTRSKDFYLRLGFKIRLDEGDLVSFTWEGNRLLLAERKDIPPPPDFPRSNLRIRVPNVDDYWKLATEMDAKVLIPIADQPYGSRDFTILDPDGYGVRIGNWHAAEPE